MERPEIESGSDDDGADNWVRNEAGSRIADA